MNWLASHARFRPDALALLDVDGGRRRTYAELYDESLRWARTLHESGVTTGDRVAVLAHNRGETFAIAFACAEIGAVVQPMNWRLSKAELAWQLDNARARVLLVDDAHSDLLDHPSLRIEDGPAAVQHRGDFFDHSAPWMLMYTSGTTGKPKGALLTHQQLYANAATTVLACDLTVDDVTLTFTPLFHTGGMNCLSTPLFFRGGAVVLTRGFDTAQAIALIQEHGVSLLMGVPTMYQMLADDPSFEDADLSSVRDALCGGAPLSLPLLERYLDREIPLRQGFGMTEVGPNCFSMPPHETRRKLGSVGLPIHNLDMRLVTSEGTEAAVDEPGELWMRGAVVFGGYFERDDANDKSFVDGWFRTGDVLARDDEGYFRVVGRTKEMFISGGENVYPAEIEQVLLSAPGVGQVAVVGVPDARWGEVGHAFVEPEPGHSLDEAQLRDFLHGKLARFKQPKHYTLADALPRTASGKIDKNALNTEVSA